jgi:hypothetical protein
VSFLIPPPTNRPFVLPAEKQCKEVIWSGEDGEVHRVAFFLDTRSIKLIKGYVSARLDEGQYAFFKKDALSAIGRRGDLEKKAEDIGRIIDEAMCADLTGVWKKGTCDEKEDAFAFISEGLASPEADQKTYRQMVMVGDLGQVDERARAEAAGIVAAWATTDLAKQLLALSREEKPRFPQNPRERLTKIGREGFTERAKRESEERYIVKFRVNSGGDIIISVEFPLALGGTKTVRRKLDCNITKLKTEKYAYSRIGKWFLKTLRSEMELARREIEYDYMTSLDLKDEDIGLILEAKYSKDGVFKGYKSALAEGSAEELTKESFAPGTTRYTGKKLWVRLLVFRDLLHFLCILHEKKGMVHQDIKPANLLLFGKDEEVRGIVMDYSTVRGIGEQIVEGSPLYRPPEESDFAQPTADCYAAGVTLKQLLRGTQARVRGIGEVLEDLIEGDPIDDLNKGLCDPLPERRLTARQALERTRQIISDI